MVNRVINELNLDTAYVQVFFYNVMKSYQDLNIKINKNTPVHYKLENDTIFANMKSVTFGINISELNRINMYSRIIYTDDCTKIEHILSDSLFLLKDPHSGLVPAPVKIIAFSTVVQAQELNSQCLNKIICYENKIACRA